MTLERMAEIAARYDTAMSWAMVRALLERGVSVRLPRTRLHAMDHSRAYEPDPADVLWCMANHGSPMDLARG